jgi:hypothetical protein
MKNSIDFLYNINKEGQKIERYLVSFTGENDELQTVEMDVYQDEQDTILFSDNFKDLSKDDQHLVYYLVDRWAINNLI